MKKLLTAPVKMNLTDSQNQHYQQVLKYVAELSLNFMAVKVEHYPENFLDWCKEFHRICQEDLNLELLDEHQFKPLKKLEETLVQTISINQLKLARVMPWPVFLGFVEENATRHGLNERLALLKHLAALDVSQFDQWIEEDQLAFIGKHTANHDPSVYQFDVEWFTSTKNAKPFIALLNQQPEKVAQLLASIPQTGEVTEQEYMAFAQQYQTLFEDHLPEEKAPFAPMTRLLAMARPDQFVALTKAKADVLCQGLNVSKLNSTPYQDYWHEVILTIRASHWYNEAAPTDEGDFITAIWQNRVALLDTFFFVDNQHASQSNFIRLRDKPTKARASSTTARKRTKASAEQLVDQALADESIPEFIKGMRDSIIKSVQAGKSVNEAISLMRAIFG